VEVLLVADRPLRPLAAIPFVGKHETESGHLGSAVDTAAMPRKERRRRIDLALGARPVPDEAVGFRGAVRGG
jgi:hypothetical protein